MSLVNIFYRKKYIQLKFLTFAFFLNFRLRPGDPSFFNFGIFTIFVCIYWWHCHDFLRTHQRTNFRNLSYRHRYQALLIDLFSIFAFLQNTHFRSIYCFHKCLIDGSYRIFFCHNRHSD